MEVALDKAAARKVALAARKPAHAADRGGASGLLSSVLAAWNYSPMK